VIAALTSSIPSAIVAPRLKPGAWRDDIRSVNPLLLGAVAVSVVVAAVAVVAAVRAGRRAHRAAALVSQLLEPVEVEDLAVTFGGAPAPLPPGGSAGADTGATARERAVDRGDRSATRIPVLDLDRLKGWLTEGDVELGRIAVVSIELDDLAGVYDRLGARAGSQLVEAITQRLRTLTRPRDVVAHVNHDRFVLVCRDVPDREAAEALSQRVALGVAHPSVDVAGVASVTASIGVALANDHDERPQSVLRRAVEAGKHARAAGGGRVEIAPIAETTSWSEGELATSVARDELRLHYLPIVSCATGRVAGFEALVRWEHSERGLLAASEFVGAAERSGAIVAIGNWALEEACRQLARWHAGDGGTLKLNVNLAARQFAEPTLAAQVKRIVSDSGVDPGDLWLEVTEETLLQDRETADLALRQLHEVGVRLVIDDFGSGASSLVSLKHHPIDAVKIDRAFVAELGRDRDAEAICNAIIALAHSLGLCAIAEGVETLEQFAALRSMGCDLAQGHVFGPARPAADFGDTPAATLGVVGRD
jgi:diguanylate cyclase (GGDEF)-like protein